MQSAQTERPEVRLLGPLQVRRRDGSPVPPRDWRTARTVELFCLLALHADEPVAVESILARLWPGVPYDRARDGLRRATSQIRAAVGEDCVERAAGSLLLRDVWVDVQAYRRLGEDVEDARRAGEPDTVVALAHEAEGLYFDDVALDASPTSWSYDVQRRLSEVRLKLLVDAADAARTLGRCRDSLEFAEQALQVDPSSERAVRLAMRAWADLGEVPKALAAYDRTRAHLRDRFDLEPSAPTRALRLQLVTSSDQTGGRHDVVGHEVAISALAAALGRIRRADGTGPGTGLVEVVGPRGSGRDTVIREACRRSGASVHYLTAGSSLPVPAPWADHAPGNPTGSEVIVVPHRAGEEIRRGELAARARALRAVVVLRVDRDEDDRPRGVTADHPVVQVSTLSPGELERLTAGLLQGVPDPALMRAVTLESAGLSGRACAILRRWLGGKDVLWTPSGLTLASPDDRPMAALGKRGSVLPLERLTAAALDVLSVVAVADQDLTSDEIVGLLDDFRPGHGILIDPVLDDLTDRGLLRLTAAGYRARSARTRAALLAWLRPAVRRALHVVIADSLLLDPPSRVRHWIAGGQHQRACDFASDELALAYEAGDPAAAARLRRELLVVPTRLRDRAELSARVRSGRSGSVMSVRESAFARTGS